jgi:hypothetical protein
MYPHPIQLRGPWDYEPLAWTRQLDDGSIVVLPNSLPPPGRMRMPCRWVDGGLSGFAGRVRFRRRFGKPRQLDDYERLWLVCEGADYYSSWHLNGRLLGEHQGAFDPFEFEITNIVQPRNELIVEVECPAVEEQSSQWMLRGVLGLGGGLWGVVGLEVRRETFLRELRVWSVLEEDQHRLHVTAAAVDETERIVELYILLNDAVVHYGQLRASPRGEAFEVVRPVAQAITANLAEVKVELVAGASKLDIQVRPFVFRTGRAKEPRNPQQLVDLVEPVREGAMILEADRTGQELWIRLPLPARLAADEMVQQEAHRQCRVIVQELMHHPGIAGWVVPSTVEDGEAQFRETVQETIRAVDPSRVCL